MPRPDHPAIRLVFEAAAAEADKSPPPTAAETFAAEASAEPEAAARKQRSLAILQREGVPIDVHLPLIETESMIPRRSDEAVALRAIALAIVAKAAYGDRAATSAPIEAYRIAAAFTPQERAFIDDPQPAKRDGVQLTWRIECAWVPLWALGFVDSLGRPDDQIDPGEVVRIIEDRGRDGLVAAARLRPAGELLDAADLIYRYHWAVRDAQFHSRAPPAGINADVVAERHCALNWLIGYGDAEWDEVSTDT
jgi:hypothetical protein